MYSQTAEYYDAIYSFKNYEGEAAHLMRLIHARAPGARTLLDVACGTGAHLRHLKEHFECVGLDLHEGLLRIARSKLPGVELHQGDMTHFDLGRKFDVVTCLFSAIGYALSFDRLAASLSSMSRHVNEGGMLIVEPWIFPEDFMDGHIGLTVFESDKLKISRMNSSSMEGDLCVMRFHYLIGRPGSGVGHFEETHELGMFSRSEYLQGFAAAGLEAEMIEGPEMSGRGLYLAVKR